MKKIVVLLLCLFILCGCNKTDKDKYETYIDYYQKLAEQTQFLSFSNSFDIELVKNNINDGLIRYDVIIDNPKTNMYNIIALALTIDDDYNKDNMMPSIGIFNDSYDLIVDSVNLEKHQAKGLNLSLISNLDHLQVKVIVRYETDNNTHVEYILLEV